MNHAFAIRRKTVEVERWNHCLICEGAFDPQIVTT
jgi:hypothetical protein